MRRAGFRIEERELDEPEPAEGVFLYPLAVVLNKLGWFGFWELAFFVAILALAYVYIWRKGALEWR